MAAEVKAVQVLAADDMVDPLDAFET